MTSKSLLAGILVWYIFLLLDTTSYLLLLALALVSFLCHKKYYGEKDKSNMYDYKTAFHSPICL